jgi:hypothetical protein
MPTPRDGWRDGRDPIQRWLRIVTTLVVLGVFVYLSIAPNRGADGVVVIALALGATLLLLGYEGVVRLPIIGKDEDRKEK